MVWKNFFRFGIVLILVFTGHEKEGENIFNFLLKSGRYRILDIFLLREIMV